MDSSKENNKHYLEITKKVDDMLTKLFSIWDTLGFDAETKEERSLTVISHTTDLFEEMINEEEKNKNLIFENIENFKSSISRLDKEMGESTPVTYQTLPPVKMVEFLSKRVEELTHQKSLLIHEFENLNQLNKKYAVSLGVEPFAIYDGPIPTRSYLNLLNSRINLRRDEYMKLCERFENLKKEAKSIYLELEEEPSLEFQNLPESSISQDKLKEIEKIVDDLKETREKAILKSKILKEEIDLLWVRLKEPVDQKEHFLSLGYGTSALEELNKELDRLKLIKNERLQEFLKNIRIELVEWWDRCLFGPNQRDEFTAFKSELCTNDLLELHEMEVQRVRDHFENNINIYDLISQREELWNRMKELDANAQDPKRFGNRGGQLLKEEKDRTKIQKQLPKLESQLEKLLDNYSEGNEGKEFIIQDLPFREMMANQWDEFHASKEQERQHRKMAKGSETKSANKRCGSAAPPHSDTKRYKMTPNQRPVSRNLFDKTTLAAVENYERFQSTVNIHSSRQNLTKNALSTQKQANSTMILNTGGTSKRLRSNLQNKQDTENHLPVTPVKLPRTPRRMTPGRSPHTPGNTTMTRLATARRGKLPIII